MIRIVGLQKNSDPTQEFILLQNQGGMRIDLRGHALVAESTIENSAGLQDVHVIRESVSLHPGQYALIRSCSCAAKWCHKNEGYSVFYLGLGRTISIWNETSGGVHILAPQHTFVERPDPLCVKS